MLGWRRTRSQDFARAIGLQHDSVKLSIALTQVRVVTIVVSLLSLGLLLKFFSHLDLLSILCYLIVQELVELVFVFDNAFDVALDLMLGHSEQNCLLCLEIHIQSSIVGLVQLLRLLLG